MPALLADEPAYTSLLQSRLDYRSIDSPSDTLAALQHLGESPGSYAAMVDNGRRRSVEYSIHATRAQWMRLLLDRAVPEATKWRNERQGMLATSLSHVGRAARQKLAAKHFKLKVLRESRGDPGPNSVMGIN